ncbi:hypothetical protein K227x_50710 [Rubripirellula lacrimiformis]|uniref:Lipoprotein n=1 Tax=Rubripirellula lacrimiformis TaxID=1930273 RepID=A0A517NHN7_9BACT|nr:hypothetical protein [Rubripirellula lacrimiformis]QDT06655.1 hypothetical protein K227x_50710 [Rubripirellula lacrimiformis]
MNQRIATIMTAATLLMVSSGCGTIRNFMFGRGAQCGLCNKLGSCLPCGRFGNMAPAAAPCQSAPLAAPAYAPTYAPAYAPAAPTCQAPAQGVVTAPPCGCQNYAGMEQSSDVYSSGMCGCGNDYAPGVQDPYLQSSPYMGTIQGGSTNYGEQIIGDTGYPQGAPVQPESNWQNRTQSRKFDTDGAKILYEDPIPSNAKPL